MMPHLSHASQRGWELTALRRSARQPARHHRRKRHVCEITMFSIAAGALNIRAASVFASFALSVAAHMITLPWSPGSVWCSAGLCCLSGKVHCDTRTLPIKQPESRHLCWARRVPPPPPRRRSPGHHLLHTTTHQPQRMPRYNSSYTSK